MEGTGSRLPVILKIEEALSQSVEIGKVIGREHLALNNREVNLDLIEPAGINGSMHESEATIAIAETLYGSNPRCEEQLSTIQKTRRASL